MTCGSVRCHTVVWLFVLGSTYYNNCLVLYGGEECSADVLVESDLVAAEMVIRSVHPMSDVRKKSGILSDT